MKTSETCAEVFAALAVAQGAYEKPKRSGKNGRKIQGSNKEQTVSTEADIREAIADAFKVNGLALIQGFDEERERMVTRIAHKSGEWVETYYPFAVDAGGGKNDAQAIGSGATYARRYGLIGATGIRLHDADDFDDGKEAAPQRTTARAPRQEQGPDDIRDEATAYAQRIAEEVKTADRHALMEIENRENGDIIRLSKEFPDLHARLQQRIDERWQALDGHQASPNGKASLPKKPQDMNGEAARV